MKRWFVIVCMLAAFAVLRAEEAETLPATTESEVSVDESTTESAESSGLRVSTWRVDGRLDYQVMRMEETMPGMPDMTDTRGELMAAELETTATIANSERDIVDLAVQWPYLTDMKGVDDRGKEMHFGNAYGVYKFGLGKPNLRMGQFVAPFGNLPYYETHTRPLQSLYPNSLGVRIDRGVSLEGFAGDYDYWVAAVGGNGARSDNNDSPTVLGRVARRYDLLNGTLTAGVSALYGTDMPRFSTLVDPVMGTALPGMPLSASLDFTDKTRVALDAEYSAGQDIWRAELVAGRDSDGGVNGQFLQWNRALTEKNEVTAQVARWEQPGGNRLRVGASFGHRLDDYTLVRLTAERSQGHVPGTDHNETMVAVQLTRDFPGLAGR
ncbi:MAG: hypothetical protein BWY76_00049 [bacterium ADurb.Bin429]|nr:MAG: hypothetical protein BWY76_00049 [bacterium ADurb.Bin429]